MNEYDELQQAEDDLDTTRFQIEQRERRGRRVPGILREHDRYFAGRVRSLGGDPDDDDFYAGRSRGRRR